MEEEHKISLNLSNIFAQQVSSKFILQFCEEMNSGNDHQQQLNCILSAVTQTQTEMINGVWTPFSIICRSLISFSFLFLLFSVSKSATTATERWLTQLWWWWRTSPTSTFLFTGWHGFNCRERPGRLVVRCSAAIRRPSCHFQPYITVNQHGKELANVSAAKLMPPPTTNKSTISSRRNSSDSIVVSDYEPVVSAENDRKVKTSDIWDDFDVRKSEFEYLQSLESVLVICAATPHCRS